MIPIPNGKFIFTLSIPLLLIVGGFIYPGLTSIGIAFNVIIFIIAILDILITKANTIISVELAKNKLYSIGRINHFKIMVQNQSTKHQIIQFKLELPQTIQDQFYQPFLEMSPFSEHNVIFKLRPIRRGSYQVNHLFYRLKTNFGWFYLHSKKKIKSTIDVYPDIKQLNYFLKLTRKDRVYEMGVHKNRWKGLGTELEYLKEYQKDDDSKYIDWKASTRLNKPVTKVFQMESNNHLTLAIDCGRLMTSEQDGLNTLDHAVNSLLILSHIAYRLGDTISIIAYSDHIIAELPEVKGKSTLNRITSFITKLEPEYVESNYKLVFEYLHRKVKKRSLVVFLTDLIDDINYHVFKVGISRTAKKHQVLFILLRDILLSQNADKNIKVNEDLYTKAAAQEMFIRRKEAISKLIFNKVNVIDVIAAELSGRLINK